ncbi:MAG: tRNA (guanosine(37)-N1)-methyltransferase TrmD [Pirellulaceae bacterium]|jgi:tRNA (guanine37-N1)-methyltransferase|nr:tRNA (guanosine(37)-N1)-methyltransferase TrmD [Pirellulaceae bacterium]
MRVDILTLFPEIFTGYVGQSLLSKAIERKLVEVHFHDMRNWANDKFRRVDDRPFGGGPGMVLMAEPVVNAIEAVQQMSEPPADAILLTPQGEKLDQRLVEDLAQRPRLLLICGRYEGFDQRILDITKPREISVGDFILNGGEVAAMTIIDSVFRLLPGVLGDESSSIDDSFSSGNRLLEFPQYTRPRVFRGLEVPEVLLNGNHAEIERWRREQSLEKTRRRRADLLD